MSILVSLLGVERVEGGCLHTGIMARWARRLDAGLTLHQTQIPFDPLTLASITSSEICQMIINHPRAASTPEESGGGVLGATTALATVFPLLTRHCQQRRALQRIRVVECGGGGVGRAEWGL